MNFELNDLRLKICSAKRMCELFEFRLHYIDENKANKSNFQKNEDEILKHETTIKIERLRATIFEMENEFIALCSQ